MTLPNDKYRNDSVSLCREQRADVFTVNGIRSMIVDHPLNSPLIGTPAEVVVVRASEFTLQPGDKTIAIYTARAGGSRRVATADTANSPTERLHLIEWRIEPGFEHEPTDVEGCTIHRIVKSR